MPDRGPGAGQAVTQLLQRQHHAREARFREPGDLGEACAALTQHFRQRRLDVLGADVREQRERRVGEQWIERRGGHGGRACGGWHLARVPEPGQDGNPPPRAGGGPWSQITISSSSAAAAAAWAACPRKSPGMPRSSPTRPTTPTTTALT